MMGIGCPRITSTYKVQSRSSRGSHALQVESCVAMLQLLAIKIKEEARLRVFGSRPQGLAMKDSDVDLALSGVLPIDA